MILFRDTYKSAMDDIKPDSGLLGTILSRTDEENAKIAKKTFSRKWVYSVGACAASFVLVTCSVIGYNRYSDVNRLPAVVSDGVGTNNTADKNETGVGGTIVPELRQKETDTVTVPSVSDEKSTSLTAKSAPKLSEKKTDAAQKRDIAANAESSESKPGDNAVREDAVQNGDIANDVMLPEVSSSGETGDADVNVASFAAPLSESAQTDDEAAAKGKAAADSGAVMADSSPVSGAGGGSMRSASYFVMTADEYAEYIGIDVSKYLPLGFSRSGDDTVYIGADGSAAQSFVNADGRTVSITLAVDSESIEGFVKDSSLEKLTDKAVCDEYDGGCIVYGYGEDIAYTISGNLTKNEAKRLAEAISK